MNLITIPLKFIFTLAALFLFYISFAQEATEETSFIEKESNNNLKEFGVDAEAPDLFNSDYDTSISDDLLSSTDEDQEDDLEIPAFLRRQKN